MNLEVQPRFFSNQHEFRKWLEENHEKETELFVGYYKVNSGKPSMTWSESVDQALCFGWIDGVRKSIDDVSYFIRFTKRKPNSIWSAVNIKKIEELKRQEFMKPAGIAVFNLRLESRSKIYAYEKEDVKLSEDFEARFRANKKAWSFFQSLPPSYHKPATNWVMSAKQETTKAKRLEELIRDSEAGQKIKRLSY